MAAFPWYIWFILIFAGAFLAFGAVWLLAARRVFRAPSPAPAADPALEQHTRLSELETRLTAVLQLNRDLVEACDENALVRAALSTVNRLVSGLGCTYTPFDAWGQPLPAFTYGDMPEPVMKGWAEHLLSEPVRRRCSGCQALQAAPGQSCPLQFGPFGGTMSIYCLPLALGERRLGMVNIYLPAGRGLPEDLHQFLTGLMNEMALAIEAQRLRAQEVTTLRQLHHLRSPRANLSGTLEALLESVCRPLALDSVLLRVQPLSNERLSGLEVFCGDPDLPLFARLKNHWNELFSGDFDEDLSADSASWLALPLTLPEGQTLGLLVAARKSGENFTPSQKAVLETAAAQAALMIENERLNMKLEYTLVIQERTRLAREIHDGLAQILAFLKMQSSQMQSALTQGDQQRLARLLHESRQAIADAYSETRQAIDNLRVNSDEGLVAWLAQTGLEFEKSAQVRVHTHLPEREPGLLPEIQAQIIRITQEALNNVRKHAQAKEVLITLRRLGSDDPRVGDARLGDARAGDGNMRGPDPRGEDWILEIADDGCGFEPEDVPLVARYGLRGMRERADLIGAEFQITSQPARGTRVRLFLPAQIQEVGE